MLKRLLSRLPSLFRPLLLLPVLALPVVPDAQATEIMAIAKDLKPGENGLPPLASDEPIGVRVMDSTPPATTTS